MNSKQLKSVLTNPEVFKKALLEDLENTLKNSDTIKGEIEMARRYNRVNKLNSRIKRTLNEAEELDMEEDEIEGSTDDVRESFRKVRKALKEAEEELEVAEEEGQDVSSGKPEDEAEDHHADCFHAARRPKDLAHPFTIAVSEVLGSHGDRRCTDTVGETPEQGIDAVVGTVGCHSIGTEGVDLVLDHGIRYGKHHRLGGKGQTDRKDALQVFFDKTEVF